MCNATTIITITLRLFLFSSWLDFQRSRTPLHLNCKYHLQWNRDKGKEIENTNKMQFILASFFPHHFCFCIPIFQSIFTIISFLVVFSAYVYNKYIHSTYSSMVLFSSPIINGFLLYLTSNEKKLFDEHCVNIIANIKMNVELCIFCIIHQNLVECCFILKSCIRLQYGNSIWISSFYLIMCVYMCLFTSLFLNFNTMIEFTA